MSSRNRHSQELCEQTATQDSNCHPRFSHCEHYVIRWREDIYPATHIITDCTQLLQQTKKKTSQQNPVAHHQRSVTLWWCQLARHVFYGIQCIYNFRGTVARNR